MQYADICKTLYLNFKKFRVIIKGNKMNFL